MYRNWTCLFLLIFVFIGLSNTFESIYKKLRYFETLHADHLTNNIVKRALKKSEQAFNKDKEVSFSTLGRNFRIILTPKRGILHSKFMAYEVDDKGKETTIDFDYDQFYEGRVFDESDSYVSLHLNEGVMTGSIHLPDEIYYIEPSWRHMPEHDNRTMIAYKSSDVNFSRNRKDLMRTKTSDYVKESIELENESETENHWTHLRREKRQYNFKPTKTRCPLLLVADYSFFKEMGSSNTKTTINYLISLIDRVHKIFNETIWQDQQEETYSFTGMGFVIKKILVHSAPTKVREGEEHYNMVRVNWDIRNLLEIFSRPYYNKEFCLAHLFTHTTFTENPGVLNLAYVASSRRNTVGGICTFEYFKNGHTLYLNTGLSSSQNLYGQRVITREADLRTAHELGHNWGSEHDPDIPECFPNVSQGGSYLMYSYGVKGYDVNNKKFSPCSQRSIRTVLLAKSERCFLEPEESICGNSRVEGDEECDAGILGADEEDACCDSDCKLRRSQGAVCSDKNSQCCQNCNYMDKGLKCRNVQFATCEQESSCSGTHAECPTSLPMPDGTDCAERGKCKNGKCTTFCETQGLESCMCDITEDDCKYCCRSSLNATCFPPKPAEHLPDGTTCIQGFCHKGNCVRTIENVETTPQDLDIIEVTNRPSQFFRDNIVGTIAIVTALVWIPAMCIIRSIDLKRRIEGNIVV